MAEGLVTGCGLRGRDDVLAVLGSALDRARDHHGSAMVLRGGTGSGKSTLLRSTADRAVAVGWQVFQFGCTEQGARVPFSALRSLAYPVLNTSPDLPQSLRNAFLEAMAGGVGATDALLAYSALRQLLFAAARVCPTLVVVDDCQWLDTGSARALAFLSHRLEGSRLMTLAATSEHGRGPFDGDDALHVELKGIDDPSARLLLADHHPGLAPLVRSTVLSAAAGNPLALMDLPAALTDAQRRGEAALPEPLPAGPALDRALGGRFRDLPADTRTVLALLAMTDGGVDRSLLASVSVCLGTGPDALDAAERAGLVVGDRLLRFAQPVYRSLADSTAPASLRRKAYAAWAQCGPADSHASGDQCRRGGTTDEETGRRFEALAETALTRGQWNAAVRAYRSAGELGAHPDERTRRQAAAGSAALRAGRPSLALALTRSLSGADDDSPTARTLRLVRAHAEYETAFSARRNRGELSAALSTGPVVGADVRDEAALRLAELSSLLHDPGPARHALAWLDRSGVGDGPLRVAVTAHLGPASGGAADLRARLLDAAGRIARDPGRAGSRELTWLADTALRIDESALANHLVTTALRRAEPTDRSLLHHGWSLQAELLVSGGRWTELRDLAPSRIEAAEREGFARRRIENKAQLLVVSVCQGRYDEAGALLWEVRQWGEEHDSPHHVHLADHAACLLALARGDDPTDGGTAAAAPLADGDPLTSVVVRRAHVDLIRAALARQDLEQARRLQDRAVALELHHCSADMALRIAHGEALIGFHADAPGTHGQFRHAHVTAAKSSRPFDRARLALDYGIWLRRQRETPAARTQLRAAHDAFARLGAAPWRDRAREELRAIGVGVRDQGPATPPAPGVVFLSAQEQRIARLAAAGLSNRQIAERLFISPRTVGSHLYKVFPRLGISSRRELRRALQGLGDHAGKEMLS
ncbi:AAA family ATPase [Streptomyces sp. NPDC059894]|uniref:helix-turn-helix transcriptional regulator n=1 Tax=unclassified Streptomyces TaxID=2593676 RepID=UPI003647EB56